MAIGASPYRMLASILGEGLTQVGLGLIVGTVLSLLTARLLAVCCLASRRSASHRMSSS